MNSLTLFDRRSRATARIAPELGLNCHSLLLPCFGQLVEILDCEPEFGTPGSSPTRSGIPLLFPFPNRIRDARFHFQDKTWELQQTRRDPAGNAIHGYVMNRSWRVTRHESNALFAEIHFGRDLPDLRPEWPADFRIEVCYLLDECVLRCDVRILNVDREPLPWGFGTHAYFRIPLTSKGGRGDVLLQAPVSRHWEIIDSLPTGTSGPLPPELDLREGLAVGELRLDHVFGGLHGQGGRTTTTVLDPTAGIQVTQCFGPEFRDLVVFTPPHGRSVCLEPYTCLTDAANLQPRGVDAGWQVLQPGEERRLWFEITAGPILV